MTEDNFDESTGAPFEALIQHLRRDLELLSSPSAYWRMRGIGAVTEQGRYEATPRLKELLDDDSPVVFDGLVTEVRMFAQFGLQRLHHRAKSPLELAPVAVRRAMPLAEVHTAYAEAIASLSEAARRDVLARANEVLELRVQPNPKAADDARAYRVLQELGRVSYEWQRRHRHDLRDRRWRARPAHGARGDSARLARRARAAASRPVARRGLRRRGPGADNDPDARTSGSELPRLPTSAVHGAAAIEPHLLV